MEEQNNRQSVFNSVLSIFDYVVEDSGLIIAIDLSGVYVFTERTIDTSVIQELKQDLDLNDNEIVLVSVDCINTFSEIQCKNSDLAETMLKVVCGRECIFSDSDFKEILECFELTPGDSSNIIKDPNSLYENGEIPVEEVASTVSVAETRKYFVKQAKMITVVCVFGFIVFALNLTWWLPLIPFLTSLVLSSRLGETSKLSVANILVLLSFLGFVLTALYAIFTNLTTIQTFLGSLSVTGNLDFFKIFGR